MIVTKLSSDSDSKPNPYEKHVKINQEEYKQNLEKRNTVAFTINFEHI